MRCRTNNNLATFNILLINAHSKHILGTCGVGRGLEYLGEEGSGYFGQGHYNTGMGVGCGVRVLERGLEHLEGG